MEGEDCFNSFASKLTSMPHVAENILRRLDAPDVANCLKVCRGFRRLISSALQWNRQLQADLDFKASRFAVTSLTLAAEHRVHVEREDAEQTWPRLLHAAGIDGSLWIWGFKPAPPKRPEHHFSLSTTDTESDSTSTQAVYDLQSGAKLSNMLMPKASMDKVGLRILPGKVIMRQETDKVILLAKENESCKMTSSVDCIFPEGMRFPSGVHLEEDSIYKCLEKEDDPELPWELRFWKFGPDGRLEEDGPVIRLEWRPRKIKRKVTQY